MKESNFYSDEFEQLIREKTEQYKMYPSEKVWKGIHGSLHTKRKWFFGTMALMVTGILFMAGKELIAPPAHGALTKKLAAATGKPEVGPSRTAPGSPVRSSFSTFRQSISSPAISSHSSEQGDKSSPGGQPYKEVTITIGNPVISQPDLSEFLSHAVHLPAEAPPLPVTTIPSLPVTASRSVFPDGPAERSGDGTTGRDGTAEGAGAGATSVLAATDGTAGRNAVDASARSVLESLSAHAGQDARNSRVNRNGLAAVKPGQESIIQKGALPDSAGESVKTSANTIAEASDRQRINWLRDYAVYTLPAPPKRARTYLQLSLSPTVSFRSLAGGDFAHPKTPSPVPLPPPGDYVDHAPAVGFELGGSLLYRLTRNLTVKGGLQFNFSRYKIKTYGAASQQQTAFPGGLTSPYGIVVDSLTSVFNGNSFGSSNQEVLNNDFYQLSIPVGFELRILGNERLQFNIGGTIAPSYLLNGNAYMLSADYTDYIKAPYQYRRWNLNAGMETFISYRTNNGIRLQIGPEFRYQLLSTYNSGYPIRENQRGYGIKVGITKIIP
jgi:hypothetical protein